MRVLAIIPARYASSRFPGKPLAKIVSKSMIQRVYEQCKKCEKLTNIIVATDDKRIHDHVSNFGGKSIMTKNTHISGTDRCGEVLIKIEDDYDIIINVQGDEPYIAPEQISELLKQFNNKNVEITTLAKETNDPTLIKDKNSPKVIFDEDYNAISFYRNPESISKINTHFKHIGIYAFKSKTLEEIVKLSPSKNEKKEDLEQMRWIDNKFKIKIGLTNYDNISVDTPEDILKIEAQIR